MAFSDHWVQSGNGALHKQVDRSEARNRIEVRTGLIITSGGPQNDRDRRTVQPQDTREDDLRHSKAADRQQAGRRLVIT